MFPIVSVRNKWWWLNRKLLICWLGLNVTVLSLCRTELILLRGNKANLRDLIAVTGLIILHKLDSNYRFLAHHMIEIWWVTSKNNRASLLCYVKLCATFQSHWWIKTGVTVQKCPIHIDSGQNQRFFCPMWPWNLTDDLEKTLGNSSMLCQALCIIL